MSQGLDVQFVMMPYADSPRPSLHRPDRAGRDPVPSRPRGAAERAAKHDGPRQQEQEGLLQ